MQSLTVVLAESHLVRILNVASKLFDALLHFDYAIIAFPSYICLRQILVLNVFKASRVNMATHVRVNFRWNNFESHFSGRSLVILVAVRQICIIQTCFYHIWLAVDCSNYTVARVLLTLINISFSTSYSSKLQWMNFWRNIQTSF